MHRIRLNLLLSAGLLLSLFGLPLLAVTITVDAVDGNDGNDGQTAAVKTLKAAWALMPAGGGHTMLIKAGTYSDPNDAVITSDIVNGTIGNYNIIKAETDGTAIIMQPMNLLPLTAAPAGFPSTSDNLATTPQFLQFEGLKWHNEINNTPIANGGTGGDGANVSIVGHHIKFLRSSFRGAGNCQNFSTLAIGRGATETQNWKPTHHILIEDSWSYGLGGRYNVSIFHAEEIIIRRMVLRHDGGWNGATEVAGCKNDPEAAIATYNSSDVQLQNIIVIDSDIPYSAPGGTSDNLATTPQFLQFEGLKWHNEINNTPIANGGTGGDGANVSIVGHHIKFLRSSFRGAGNCQNFSTLAIGRGATETQNWKPTHHILIEDSWSYGLGGRYNVSIFHAEEIIIRRMVLRHDGGWNGATEVAGCKNDPEAAIATYNSSDVQLQNIIVIDSDIPYSAPGGTPNGNWEGTIYTLYNAESGVQNVNNPQNDIANANVLGVIHDNTGSTITGSIILFAHGNGYKYEVGNSSQVTNADGGFPPKSVTSAVLQDSVVLNAAVHGLTVATGGGGSELIEVDISNVLIATTETNTATRMNFGVRDNDGAGNNDLDLNNVLIIGHENNALLDSGGNLGFDEVNVDCFDANGNNCLNALGASPIGSDVKFPLRLEAGAAITSGPTIIKRVGATGTLLDDGATSTNLTATDLWPWPYESRIKKDFSEVAGVGIRRWTATDLTLTEYIWNALGADVATDGASAGILMGVPSGVGVP